MCLADSTLTLAIKQTKIQESALTGVPRDDVVGLQLAATLKDIATDLGVSLMTVSKALRSHSDISEET